MRNECWGQGGQERGGKGEYIGEELRSIMKYRPEPLMLGDASTAAAIALPLLEGSDQLVVAAKAGGSTG